MYLSNYLNFPGTCEEAFKFYAQHLGGEIKMMMTHETAPAEMQIHENWSKKIMHVEMKVGETLLMGSDAPPQMYKKPEGFYVSLTVASAEEAEKIWAALSKDGDIRMPLSETFFAKRFGMLADKFGIPWMINCAA